MLVSTMIGAAFLGHGRLELVERPIPRIGRDGDVLLKVEACGICGSDLKILSVPPGHPATPGTILGHEFVGVVEDTGPDAPSLRHGDRVVVAPNISCGQCAWCRRGARVHCERLTTHGIYLDGGLAPYVVVPATACHRIAPEVPRHIAALAEPLSTVVHGARRASVFIGDTAVVIGGGPIGLMFTALLCHSGARVLVVEPAAKRRALATELGASLALPPDSGAVRAAVDDASGGLGADVVVDAVGSQLPTALSIARKRGRVVLFGVNTAATAEITQFAITGNEIDVLGAMVGQDVFPAAVRLIESGVLNLEPLVTHRIKLAELPQAVEDLRDGRAVKVTVEFS
jgi:threonine dehydrogenase-like Zn-dependent dehydrogenase